MSNTHMKSISLGFEIKRLKERDLDSTSSGQRLSTTGESNESSDFSSDSSVGGKRRRSYSTDSDSSYYRSSRRSVTPRRSRGRCKDCERRRKRRRRREKRSRRRHRSGSSSSDSDGDTIRRTRSPSERSRRKSPSLRDKRRITSARKCPVEYDRKQSSDSDVTSSSSDNDDY